MPQTTQRDLKLIEHLNDAYATERRLEIALQAHIAVTPRRDYKARLREHLKETKAHARGVARRIKQLGGDPASVSLSVPGPEPLTAGLRVAQTAAQQAVALAQGPLHAVRGTSKQERMLKNARTEFQDEAEEIANYRAIEALSKAVGDKDTAKLARDIQREEKRMSDFLAGIIDQLAIEVVQEELPEEEISGTARRGNGRRTAARSRSGGGTRSAKSGTSRSASASKTGGSRGSSRSGSAAKSGTARSRTAAKSSSGSRGRSGSSAKRR
jgi:ferritin-like metal-binding protein YciE